MVVDNFVNYMSQLPVPELGFCNLNYVDLFIYSETKYSQLKDDNQSIWYIMYPLPM